jgi:CRISPR/Cas system type I-B associated protein Csh2 (Cas7 group RAMP superfamily)
MSRIYTSRKALFQTPVSNSDDEPSMVTANVAYSKLDIAAKALANVHAENEYNMSIKESHKERLDKLKLLLNEIEEDNWKYDNVSKLIGI